MKEAIQEIRNNIQDLCVRDKITVRECAILKEMVSDLIKFDTQLGSKEDVSDEKIETIAYNKSIEQIGNHEDDTFLRYSYQSGFGDGLKWMQDKQGIAPKEVKSSDSIDLNDYVDSMTNDENGTDTRTEVSDEEIEVQAKTYSMVNYCKASKQSNEDAKYIQAVAENSFIQGYKMMRDKQGIAPSKPLEWSDNMLQGSIDKAYEILKGQSDFGSPVYSHNQAMRSLLEYSSICQKSLFKAFQIKPFIDSKQVEENKNNNHE